MKLLHLFWLIELYNYVNLSAGREACMKKSGIYSAVVKGIHGLASLDPFKDIDHLVENENLMNMITYDESSFNERQYCVEKNEGDSKPEWEDDVGNIFECLNNQSSDNESRARAKHCINYARIRVFSDPYSPIIRTKSTILSLYGRIRVTENPYSRIFFAAKAL